VLDQPLDEEDVHPDPVVEFGRWFAAAREAGQPEPEAMALATADQAGLPSVRWVLMRGFDERGVVFYTNGHSRKGRDIAANPRGAVGFRWWVVDRQVRWTGEIVPIEPTASDAYFAGRPRGSQLGAWASAQSEVLASRADLDDQFEVVSLRFAGREVPRPPWWGGYRLEPAEIEFWQSRPHRLHDRLRYVRADGVWRLERLSP
jgi:pyridoxamine 5'-phosphate oxidase